MATDLLWNGLDYPWSYGVTHEGRIFFINDSTRSTSWLHPRTLEPVQTGYRVQSGLPTGWEQCVTPEGAIYYIDHNTCRNTFFHPVTGESQAADQKPRLDASPTSELPGSAPTSQHNSSNSSHSSLPITPPSPAIRPTTFVKKIGSNKRAVIDRPPSARRLPQAQVLIRGWLHRQDATGLRNWKRRWCLLADYCLYCYRDETEEFCDCSVPLPSYKVNPCTREDPISRNYAFKIEHDNMQTIYFAADNKAELQRWMNSLSLATILQSDPRASQSPPMQKPKGLDENSNSLTDRSNDGYGTFARSQPQDLYPDKGVYRTSGFSDLRPRDGVATRRDPVGGVRDDAAQDDSHSDSVFESMTQDLNGGVDESNASPEGKPMQAKEALRLWHLSSDTTPRNSLSAVPADSPVPFKMSPSIQRRASSEEHLYENIPADEGPSRPPIPVDFRETYIRNLASLRTPKTKRDYEIAAQGEKRKLSGENVFQFPESPPGMVRDQPSFVRSEQDAVIGREWANDQRASPDAAPNRGATVTNGSPKTEVPPPPVRQEVPRSPHVGRQSYQPRLDGEFITIKEDPSMSDSEILETRRLRKTYSVSALNGYKPRLSITAADLMGKSHEELVLLLIQLRRDRADLARTKDTLQDMVDQRKNGEKRYRSIVSTNGAGLDALAEEEHDQYLSIKARLEEAENQLDVHTPLINLLDNLVKMGSLYNGQNNLLFSQYKRHLLNPGQVPSSKSMLDFSRQMQEAKLAYEQENGVKHLREEEEKTARLHELDARLQELSILVRSLKEDKQLLERALAEISADEKRYRDDPRHLEALAADRGVLERQLSDVLQKLADQSMNLEEVEAENHKVEMEVMLLRSRIFDLSKSRSMPALSGESYHAKQQILGDLSRVQDLMNGLTERGQQLHDAMSHLRKSNPELSNGPDSPNRAQRGGTYHETDLNTLQTRDIALEKARKKAAQQPKATIKRSYSEREIRPDKNEFPPRMERARSKNLRDLKRQSERRGRGQRYEPATVKRSQSLPRFYTRAESPEAYSRRPANQSFGSTHTLPANMDRRSGSFSPQLRRSTNPNERSSVRSPYDRAPSSPDFAVRTTSNPTYGVPGDRHSMGPGPNAHSIPRNENFHRPREYHSMSEYPRERYSYNERVSPGKDYNATRSQRDEGQPDELMSPEAHRRPTGCRDVNQMSPVVHRASLPSPNSTDSDPRFSPRQDVRQKPPSPRQKRPIPNSPRHAEKSVKSVIPDRILSKSDVTEITADSPSVIQVQGRDDAFAHLRPNGSLPRGETLKLLKSQIQGPDTTAYQRARSPQSVSSAQRIEPVRASYQESSPHHSFNQDTFAHLRPPSYAGSLPRHEIPSSPGSLDRDGPRASWASGHSSQRPPHNGGQSPVKEFRGQPEVRRGDPRGHGPVEQGQSHDNRSYGYLPEKQGLESAAPTSSRMSNGDQRQRPSSTASGHGPSQFDPRSRSHSDGAGRVDGHGNPRPGSTGRQTVRHDTSFHSDRGFSDERPSHERSPDERADGYAPPLPTRAHDIHPRRSVLNNPEKPSRQFDNHDYYGPNARPSEQYAPAGTLDRNRQTRESDKDPRRRDGSRERTKPIGGSRVGSYSPRMAARHAQNSTTNFDKIDGRSDSLNDPERGRARQRSLPPNDHDQIRPSVAPSNQSVPQNHIPTSQRNGRGRNMTSHSSEPSRLEYGSRLTKEDYDSGSDIELRRGPPRHASPARQLHSHPTGGWGQMYPTGDTLIDREVLMAPDKVEIPERYVPESELDDVSDNERYHRQEKSEKLKRLLSRQSLQDWRRGEIDVPSRNSLHEKVTEERKRREDVLELRQELAQQVTQLSKQVAVAANERQRRKTWSSAETKTTEPAES